MRKRKINSEAELVNALCKDIKVDKYSIDGVFIESITFDNIMEDANFIFNAFYKFRYSDPVEVVELWGWIGELSGRTWFEPWEPEGRYTYKQTQIHLNGEIIWTETEKI